MCILLVEDEWLIRTIVAEELIEGGFAVCEAEDGDQASALINVARNVGGSMGVSLAQNVLAYRQQFHQSRLGEHVSSVEPAYQETLRQATQYFSQNGYAGPDAQNQAIAWIGGQLQTQVAFFAYIDVFWVLAIVAGCAVPLAMILKNVKLGGGAPAGH